jgi:demethylmenaquinone methyltransferase/2-methoxy-6-polyprenyl-1,4-benzoquinol methylase
MQKSKEKIGKMFDEISEHYDLLNHLFTLNLDKKWRRKIIREIQKKNYPKDNILDIASGTGDLTKELTALNPVNLYSCDISEKMLDVQKKKINYNGLKIKVADASGLPYEDNSIDIVTIGFGVRNFENLEKSLAEIYRVLKKGGYLIVLEMFGGKGFTRNIFDVYFGKVMTKIGNKISQSKYAYDYLFNSVKNFHTIKEFTKLTENIGFKFIKTDNNFLNFVYTAYFIKK